MKDELERIRQARLKASILSASNDPLFLSDIKQTEKDFEFAGFDALRVHLNL